MQQKIVGVLGGMGPEATLDFMSKVIAKTTASADQDHLRMLIDHNPKVPNRNEAIKGIGEDSGAHLAEMAKNLENAGADFLVMVCNTAHAFKTDIENAVDIPFVSIIDEVTSALSDNYPKGSKVGVMAAQGCIEASLYQQSISNAGLEPVLWSDEELDQFMALMYQIKQGDTGLTVRERTINLANTLIQKGADVILAGCTEIPLVLSADDISVPMLASTDILVEQVIDYSLGNKNI